MAYLRFGADSDWYVFWYADRADEEAEATGARIPRESVCLAIWHVQHRSDAPLFTYREVRRMLELNDFSPVAGFEPAHRDALREALREFVNDVDAVYGPEQR